MMLHLVLVLLFFLYWQSVRYATTFTAKLASNVEVVEIGYIRLVKSTLKMISSIIA